MSHLARVGCLVAALLVPCAAAPAAFSFLRIAHTSQAIPGGAGNFIGFDPAATIVGGANTVAFRGFGSGGQEGIYQSNGTTVTRLVDLHATVPGTGGNFSSFDSPTGQGPVYFRAAGAGRTGIYRATPSSVQTVDDAPAASAVFGRAAASLNNVAYLRNGVVMSTRSGSPQPVAFAPPPGLVLQQFGDPDVADLTGVLGNPVGARVNYLDNGVPRSGVIISTFGAPDQIFFTAPSNSTGEASINWSGIVVALQAGGEVLRYRHPFTPADFTLDTSRPIPGGTGNFTGFRTVSAGSPNLGLFDTEVVFVGTGAGGQEGIYYVGRPGPGFPPLSKLIARGDPLDGRIVAGVDIGRDAEFGVAVTFRATFTDGSSGIYYTVIPEPISLGLLGCAGAAILLRRRCPRVQAARQRFTACIACSL